MRFKVRTGTMNHFMAAPFLRLASRAALIALTATLSSVTSAQTTGAKPMSVSGNVAHPSSTVSSSATLMPYLQMLTTSSVAVRWLSPEPVVGTIRFGPRGTGMPRSIADKQPTLTHTLTLAGLPPDTEIEYVVSDPNLQILSRVFRTFPLSAVEGEPATQPRPRSIRAWILGDAGSGYPGEYAVRDSYTSFTARISTDAILLLGDNAYNRGTFTEYRDKLFNVMTDAFATGGLYPSMGDHDLYSANSQQQSGVYYDLFELPTRGEAGGVPSGTKAYYSFDCGAVHFVCLESMMDISEQSPQMRWLRADLAAARRSPWIVAYFHWPPYTMGPYNSDIAGNLTSVRQKLNPVLEEGGVDLVLAGHSHDYERSCLVAGHYGTSETLTPKMLIDGGNGPYRKAAGHTPHAGTIYVVLGCSGIPKARLGHHPIMRHESSTFGSGVIDADSEKLTFTFLTSEGKIDDRFQLERNRN